MFVYLFMANAKTTEQLDAKCSGITKNNPESVLLKTPILVLSGRYREVSVFSLRSMPFLLISLPLLALACTSFNVRLLLLKRHRRRAVAERPAKGRLLCYYYYYISNKQSTVSMHILCKKFLHYFKYLLLSPIVMDYCIL